MRVCGVDVGARCGFGLLAPGEVRSGSYQFVEDWYPLGRKAGQWEQRLIEQLDDFRPDHIGIARQFVSRRDTPKNLLPLYFAFTCVIKTAYARGIACHWVQESDARNLLLGHGNCPQGSKAVKLAINLACKERGWPCCDHNASDALCLAAAVVEKLSAPDQRHQTAPLFATAKP